MDQENVKKKQRLIPDKAEHRVKVIMNSLWLKNDKVKNSFALESMKILSEKKVNLFTSLYGLINR